MKLYAHPFLSYCQKALIALYENDTPFEFRLLEGEAVFAELIALWPVRKFPVLRDGDRAVVEATAIIEHLAVHHPGPVRLIPLDHAKAIEVRMMDRVFDYHVSTPQQKLVADAAPALFYADWSHPIDDRFATLKAYRARLLARPSMARVVDEDRRYRSYFPLSAPDRD